MDSSPKKCHHIENQRARAYEIAQYQFKRMGYPVIGRIEGFFKDGRFIRTDGPRPENHCGKPLVDLSHLGILPGSVASVYMNNAGPPTQDCPTVQLDHKQPERNCLKLLTTYFGAEPDELEGYVTSGSTEGNMFAVKKAKDYCLSVLLKEISEKLKMQLTEITAELERMKEEKNWEKAFLLHEQLTEVQDHQKEVFKPVIYFSDRAHYCFQKIADYLDLEVVKLESEFNGEVSIKDFRVKMMEHQKNNSHRGVICVATIGTTQEGAVDKVDQMKEILTQEIDSKGGASFLCVDAAIYGPWIPLTLACRGKNLPLAPDGSF